MKSISKRVFFVYLLLTIPPVNVFSSQKSAFNNIQKTQNANILNWNTFIGGNGDDIGFLMYIDSNNNIFIGGTSWETWGNPIHPFSDKYDGYISKLDSDGNLLWNTFLGSSEGDDHVRGIVVDNNGNIYVQGSSFSPWSCEPISCTIQAHQVLGNNNFIAKLDANGNLLWNTFHGGFAHKLVLDANNNLYIVGHSTAPWSCIPNPCTTRAFSYPDDAHVAKFDSTGTLLWNTFLGGNGSDQGESLVLDETGNIFVIGTTYAISENISGSWGNPIRPFNGADAFVAKINSLGELQWNTFLGGNGIEYGYGITIDADHNLYTTGPTDAAWSCSPTPCTINPYSGGNGSVAKLDNNGNLIWNTFFGGGGDESVYDIKHDVLGSLFIVGISDKSWGNPIRAYTNNYDSFVVNIDINGTLHWNTFFGGNGDDLGYKISFENGQVYVLGSSNETWGNPIRQYSNNSDAFVTTFIPPVFVDVLPSTFAQQYIESIYSAGITGGCSVAPLKYCPNGTVTRAQMAVFLMKGIHGSAYTPLPATGTVFNDVPMGSFAAAFIEAFATEGITGGCGNGNFCPSGLVTRAQMAVFLLKAKHGSAYTPPAATGTMFNDVPSNAFAAAWIEQLASEGITGGCGNGNYCPNASVTRAQMAVFLQKTFALPLP